MGALRVVLGFVGFSHAPFSAFTAFLLFGLWAFQVLGLCLRKKGFRAWRFCKCSREKALLERVAMRGSWGLGVGDLAIGP